MADESFSQDSEGGVPASALRKRHLTPSGTAPASSDHARQDSRAGSSESVPHYMLDEDGGISISVLRKQHQSSASSSYTPGPPPSAVRGATPDGAKVASAPPTRSKAQHAVGSKRAAPGSRASRGRASTKAKGRKAPASKRRKVDSDEESSSEDSEEESEDDDDDEEDGDDDSDYSDDSSANKRKKSGGGGRRKAPAATKSRATRASTRNARKSKPPLQSKKGKGRNRLDDVDLSDDSDDSADDDEEDGDVSFNHAALDAEREREDEEQEDEWGLGIAEQMGLAVSIRNHPKKVLPVDVAFDAFLRYLVAGLTTRDRAREVLQDIPRCADALLWANVKQAVLAQYNAMALAAFSQAWLPISRHAVALLPFVSSTFAYPADMVSRPPCQVCQNKRPSQGRVTLYGPAVDSFRLFDDDGGAIGRLVTSLKEGQDGKTSTSSSTIVHPSGRSGKRPFWSEAVLEGRHAEYRFTLDAGIDCLRRIQFFSHLLHFPHHLLLVLSDVVRKHLGEVAAEKLNRGSGKTGAKEEEEDDEDEVIICDSDDDDDGYRRAASSSSSSSSAPNKAWGSLRPADSSSSSAPISKEVWQALADGDVGQWPTESAEMAQNRAKAEQAALDDDSSDSDDDSDDDGKKKAGAKGKSGAEAPDARKQLSEAKALERLNVKRFISSLPHNREQGAFMIDYEEGSVHNDRMAFLEPKGRADFLRKCLAKNQANESLGRWAPQTFSMAASSSRAAAAAGPYKPPALANDSILAFEGDEMPNPRPLPLAPDWEKHILPLFPRFKKTKGSSSSSSSAASQSSTLWGDTVTFARKVYEYMMEDAKKFITTSEEGWGGASAADPRLDFYKRFCKRVELNTGSERMLQFAWHLGPAFSKKAGQPLQSDSESEDEDEEEEENDEDGESSEGEGSESESDSDDDDEEEGRGSSSKGKVSSAKKTPAAASKSASASTGARKKLRKGGISPSSSSSSSSHSSVPAKSNSTPAPIDGEDEEGGLSATELRRREKAALEAAAASAAKPAPKPLSKAKAVSSAPAAIVLDGSSSEDEEGGVSAATLRKQLEEAARNGK